MVAPPANLSKTPARIQRTAPELGEHTLEILRELGLPDEEVAELMAEGVAG
jgi:crotonobetainyl-CoA:carnitine CoA-transferase CaiB-like acyl-CoA transferase